MHIDSSSFRLFQLISPSFPTGAFSYSQGLEWAVEQGWVHGEESFAAWLESLLFTCFAELELPLLQRLFVTAVARDLTGFISWTDVLLACRESGELRDEEINRGQAMTRLLVSLEIETEPLWLQAAKSSQLAGFALAMANWHMSSEQAMMGYLWSWLENMVMNGVKLIPLGQTQGQRVLLRLHTTCQQVIELALDRGDDDLCGSAPALTLASCLHETQYSRLFRS